VVAALQLVATGREGAQPGPKKASLKLRENQITHLDFGRTKLAKTLDLHLDLSATPAGPSHLTVRADAFRRADDARLSSERIVPTATIIGRTVRLSVCFGRKDDRLGDPGMYDGSVTIYDARLGNEISVPITVSMQYIHGVVLLWLFGVVVLPGAWVLWVLRTKREQSGAALAPKPFGSGC
jgi:hypothetical protein